MESKAGVKGWLQVWRVRDGIRTLEHSNHNTIFYSLHTNLRQVLISQSVDYGVRSIAWGSWVDSEGDFEDCDFAGTESAATKGGLVQSAVGTNTAKFSGTFSFTTTKDINFFALGRGYVGAPIAQIHTTQYAYDDSLRAGSTYLRYENGDSFIVDWTIQIGS